MASTKVAVPDPAGFKLVPQEGIDHLFRESDKDPYRLPDDGRPVHFAFSGGRSSAYQLRQVMDRYDGVLPGRCVVLFANTGVEREETLQFIHECDTRWDVGVKWLELRYHEDRPMRSRSHPRISYEIVDFERASRSHQPFDQMIRYTRSLPNPTQRQCTKNLKVATQRRYLEDRFGKEADVVHHAIGYRYDERKRWRRALYEECRPWLPMVYARVDKGVVDEYWSKQDFDLGIDSKYGNCDMCFYKSYELLREIARKEPERARWWIEKEEEAEAYAKERGLRKMEMARWKKEFSYADLLTDKPAPLIEAMDDAGCYCTD